MESKYIKFIKNVLKLPEEVSYFFGSKLVADFIKEINNKYHLKEDFLTDLIFEIVNNNFKFYLLEEKISGDLGFDKNKTKEIVLDILGKIFMPIDDFIKTANTKTQIMNRGGKYSDYNNYIYKLNQLFEDERWSAIDKLLKKHEELITPGEEETKILNIFRYNLMDVLKEGTPGSLALLNGSLIYLLFNKTDFKNNIIKFLLNSEDKISGQKFMVGDEKRYSTISNWIKDFIKKSGSEIPNNVVISNYVIGSENAKKLSADEKSTLSKLLLLYRNIKFFPKSLEGIDPEKWEIFPVIDNLSSDDDKKIGIPKTTAEKNIEKMTEEASHYKDNSLEKLAVQEEIEHEKKIEELRFMATKFEEGSLEKKAIEEELHKLEHTK